MKKNYIILLLLFIIQFSFGQVGFQENVILDATNTGNNYAIDTVDFDGDGDLDLLYKLDNVIYWHENTNGNGDFGTQSVILTDSEDIYDLQTLDLDLDGDLDIVVHQSSGISWFENTNGLGNFGAKQLIVSPSSTTALTRLQVFDINNDNYMDIMYVYEYPEYNGQGNVESIGNAVLWIENINGSGVFGSPQGIVSSYDGIGNIRVSDIDGDGDLDVVYESYCCNAFQWRENVDGQGNFDLGGYIPSSYIYNSSAGDIEDIDGDGDMDIISTNSSSIDGIIWSENTDGLGNFNAEHVVTAQTESYYLKVVDLDNDGDMDVLSFSDLSSNNKMVWYENTDGLGTFGPEQIIVNNVNYINIDVNDIDGDGDMDILYTDNNQKIGWHKNIGNLENSINGLVRLDLNSDGCDANDAVLPNVMVSTSNGTYSFSTFTSEDGNYEIYTNTGDFTTTLQQFPNYTSNPVSHTTSFTGPGNTDTSDFCLIPTQSINDLSVAVYPSLNDPRPGFDTTYQIVYKNVGTTQLSGNVTFEFDGSKLNFLNASEAVSSQTANTLTFDYINLNPFETRTIDLEFNVFPPPTTNIDDVLVSTVTVNPTTGDDTPNNNIFTLNQTVIGSYDPNDIRVLEGEEIFLEEADEYLHYIIRFQNTGTASAIFVNVENVLDDRLDWTTMQLESLSHPGSVEITNGNMVKFIFNNINLPDSTNDEPNSHGYIAYKIKPKNDAVIGDIFNNKADIFFDFNPAIITNTVSTEIIAPLSVNEYSLSNISIYPNPTNSKLTITSEKTIDTILIFDINGRLLSSEQPSNSQPEYQLDVNNLSQGIYFLEIQSGESVQVKKFIKE
ncbi:T9SS type A sorting domain-containing protein [Kordia sp.]|uniref:T9SS type A sorting domain-containing protein n=1 Tax=Kordia sp. TaxID=1965332 RepID=UPI003B5C3A2A